MSISGINTMGSMSGYKTKKTERKTSETEFVNQMNSASNIQRSNDDYENGFDKTNWLDAVKEIMQIQYNAENLKGYLDYKKFLDFFM